jgi:integrase
VYPLPVTLEWLKRAKRLKSELPLSPKKQLADRKALRKILGWKIWKQDVTRHTAASYWLAGKCETVKHVAKMLGHSEAICESRYKAVKTQKEAEEFWGAVSSITKRHRRA